MARVEFRDVRKSFGAVDALPGLNLAVEDGELVALLGPSGCGKTTCLFLLAGLYRPTGGRLLFDGVTVNEMEARARNVGIVFQSYALYPHMSVRENIRFPLRFKNVPKVQAEQRVRDAAELVRVDGLLDRRPSQLSGGQQQRVALAGAIVKRPQLLLLDEPLSNLDATLRLSMRTEIKTLQADLGITTILVTHDQIEAMTTADRIVVMRNGRVEQAGTSEELYRRPVSVFVAEFVGSPTINMITGRAAGGRVAVGGATLALDGVAPEQLKIGLRPEHLRLQETGMPGRVTQIEPMGQEVLYVIEAEAGMLRALEPRQIARRRAGDGVRVGFEPENTLVFDGTSDTLIADAKVRIIDGRV